MALTHPVLLECYDCGHAKKLPFEAGHALFHTATYAWLLVLDFYRWKIDEHIGGAYVYEHVTPLARRFGRYLHTRGTRALSIRNLETLEQQDVQVRTFHARAARFNKIFGELPPKLRPFCYDGIDGGHGPLIPAYRMRSSRRWLVIVGVVGGGNDGVDWASFLEPALCV